MKREICAVVSKGTLTEGDLLSRHADASYLLSLTEKSATLEDRERTILGVCVVDVCTSTFMLGQVSPSRGINEFFLAKIQFVQS